jgi:hypothetical protein
MAMHLERCWGNSRERSYAGQDLSPKPSPGPQLPSLDPVDREGQPAGADQVKAIATVAFADDDLAGGRMLRARATQS